MGGGTNLIFFTLIYAKLSSMIDSFGADLMHRLMVWVAGIALVLVTLWILIQGYRVITGQMRESLMGLVTNMARIVIIVTVATSMSIFNTPLSTFLTKSLSDEINHVVTNSDDSVTTSIDKNLAYTEIAMSAIDAVQLIHSDDTNIQKANHAAFFSGIGTAGPPMTAAVMLLMYKFAMALFIGLGPLFILCLIFEQTKGMFQKWLMYGIGTLFSMAILNVVTSIVLKLSLGVAAGMWTVGILQKVFTNNVEGISHQAMEQGGLGMILTLLIVTIPPMAANFFQGTLGNFMHYSAFGGFGSRPGPQGQPPGQYAPTASAGQASPGLQNGGGGAINNPSTAGTRLPGSGGSGTPDVIKPSPSNWATQTFFSR
jgi:type IV secretion system protein VirB6